MASSSDEQFQAVAQVLDLINNTDIPYAVTGSWVVSSYGILRNTHDLDLIVALHADDISKLVAAFAWPRYYADEMAMAEASALRSFFNILDTATTLKIDFWPLKDDEYSQEQFRRRVSAEIAGRRVWMLSPEDIILAKLLWFKMSESERQWRDVETVWRTKRDEIDTEYLRLWAARLSIADLLAKITQA